MEHAITVVEVLKVASAAVLIIGILITVHLPQLIWPPNDFSL